MKEGGPAFPVETLTEPFPGAKQMHYASYTGMTLRQWYKGMALAGLRLSDWQNTSNLAQYAGEIADAMLREDEEVSHEAAP